MNTKRSEFINNRPTIAVLAQDVTLEGTVTSYIASSYVKYIESAGGRVVPILTTFDSTTVEEIFTKVNGLLIPGGAADLPGSKLYENAKLFFHLAVDANRKGDYFPIWGTCLGFEAMPIIVAETPDIMTSSKAFDVSMPLNLTSLADESRMFSDMPSSLRTAISSENITYNWHESGFTPDIFETNEKLKNFFRVLSTNTDENGAAFISSYEAKDFPFYGVMWHPEKNNFEFRTILRNGMPHTRNAVRVSQYMANFFVDETRRSDHCFASNEEEERYLIYQYTSVRCKNPIFEQIYIF